MNEPDTSRYESFVPIDFRSIQDAGKLSRVPTKELSRVSSGKIQASRTASKKCTKPCARDVETTGLDECVDCCETSFAEVSGEPTDWPSFSERSGRCSSCQSEASLDEEEETCTTTVIKNDEQTEEGQTDDCHSMYDDEEDHVDLLDHVENSIQQVEEYSRVHDLLAESEAQPSHICFPECPTACTLCGDGTERHSEASTSDLQNAADALHRRCPSDSSYFGTASETPSVTSDLSNGKSARDGRKKRLWRPPRHRRHYSDFPAFQSNQQNRPPIHRTASFSNASPFHSPSFQSTPPPHYPPLPEWGNCPQPLALPPPYYDSLGRPMQILLTPLAQAGVIYDYSCLPDGAAYTTYDPSCTVYAPSPYHPPHALQPYPFSTSADAQFHMPVQLLQAYYRDQCQQMMLPPAQVYTPPSHFTYPPSPSAYPPSPSTCATIGSNPTTVHTAPSKPKGRADDHTKSVITKHHQGIHANPSPASQPAPAEGRAGSGSGSESESEPAAPAVAVAELEEKIVSLVDEFGGLAPELSLLSEIVKTDRAGISDRTKARIGVGAGSSL